MDLIISEKAIAGNRIASILAGKDVATSYEGKAQIFAFEKNSKQFIVVPLRGHIVEVDFPKQYSYWTGTDLKKLSQSEIEYIGKEKAIIYALKKIGKQAETVVIATDADREGESIGLEALNYVKENNPKIKVKRAYFSAITPKDIETAFSKLKNLDYNLADSADSRREIDLIWGAVLTRYLSLVSGRLGKEFLSAGRVQMPALALIVDREKERLKFKQRKYWVLSALFEKNKKEFLAEHKKGKFWEKEEAEKILAKKTDQGTVVRLESKQRTIARPTPFNTTDFLRAATAIGFSAGEAMEIAESLYQMGYTSYPRTDNRVYPKTLDLKEILNELIKLPDFSPLVEKIFSLGKLSPSAGKKATKDHPPIHPVSAASKTRLTDRHWKIYALIVRRFLATLAEDAETNNQTAEIELNKEPFIARGQLIVKKGWKEFYPYSVLTEVILPELKEGELVDLKKLEMLEKETQPPVRYSQGTLIKLMEDLNLGTKATRAEIIKKLYARHYVSGTKALEPNKIAFSIIDILEKYAGNVTKPKMTAELEKEMDLIAAGKKSKGEVVEDSRGFLGEILNDLIDKKDSVGAELRKALYHDSIFGKCDKCDGQLRKLKSRNNKFFLACNNYPKCTNTYPLPQKGKLIPLEGECSECSKPRFKVISSRYSYEMCVDPNCPSKKDWGKKKATADSKEKTHKHKKQEN